MAKRRPRKKSDGRRRRRRRIRWVPQALRILASLAILLALVVGAGLVARMLAVRTSRPVAKPPVHRPVPPAGRPAYEVFEAHLPPPPPVTPQQPAVPSDRPLVAVIIDDMGYDAAMARRLVGLDPALTFSFLPFAPFNKRLLVEARAAGHQIMVHLPMEPREYPRVQPGPGALLAEMSPDRLLDQLEQDLDSVPGAVGANNHMGSRLTAMEAPVRQIMTILKKRGMYFIDSRTTADTLTMASARLLQVPYAQRDVFIDHRDDAAFIRSQLALLLRRARRQGYALGIAHPHKTTVDILEQWLAANRDTIRLVPASQVVAASQQALAMKP